MRQNIREKLEWAEKEKAFRGWHPARGNEQGTHAGLWLDKYIASQKPEDTGSRQNLVQQVASLNTPAIYARFYQRWQQGLQEAYGNKVLTRKGIVNGRMAVGLGGESVLETSITLHRTYGVPYIPGSALKGLASSYAHQHYEGETWRRSGEAHRVIFGDTEQAGYITFLDALPIPEPAQGKTTNNTPGPNKKEETSDTPGLLKRDIITVHHPEYYRDGKTAPADWDSPTPVPFLSADGSYLIALAAPDLDNADAWLNITLTILEQALIDAGIGAKTSSGYGRMTLEELH